MKRIAFILTTLVIVLTFGLYSCQKPTNEPENPTGKGGGKITSLKVIPEKLSLKVGEEKQLVVEALPKDSKVKYTFESDNEKVATISETGLVKAVSEGTATIKVKAGEVSAQCAVTIVGNGEKPQPEPGTSVNELPLLKFMADGNDQEILAYEKKLGRKDGDITLQGKKFPGFFNKGKKTIVAAVYGLEVPEFEVIAALSKEVPSNCPNTLSMLKEYGFSKIEMDNQTGGFISINDKDKSLMLQGTKEVNRELETSMVLLFMKKQPKARFNPNVKDFPSYEMLKTKDASKIKEFEKTLGFRSFYNKESEIDKVNLMFLTNKGKDSNFKLVYYVCTPNKGTPFINSIVNGIESAKDFAGENVKKWFEVNGFDTDFNASQEAGKEFSYAYTKDKKLVAQISYNTKKTAVLCQIFEPTKKTSFRQIRNIGSQLIDEAHPFNLRKR